ncbi:MAG: NAD(+)/NADH kinase, partial [Thermomicrobiales bacterium]
MSEDTSGRLAAPSSIGLVAALSKPEAQGLAIEITRFLDAQGIIVVPEGKLSPGAAEQVDGIIVLGGDGLMMRAAQTYADVPLLGINFGKVGFLAHVERDDWRS